MPLVGSSEGGVILLLFIESLMRKEISLPIKERIYQAAFVFLVLFAVMVIYNDLVKTMLWARPECRSSCGADTLVRESVASSTFAISLVVLSFSPYWLSLPPLRYNVSQRSRWQPQRWFTSALTNERKLVPPKKGARRHRSIRF